MKYPLAALALLMFAAPAWAQAEQTPSSPTQPEQSGPAPAEAPTEDVLVGVVWEMRPTGRTFARYYPPEALRAQRGGRATLDCVIGEDRKPTCIVQSEDPVGEGIGEAALRVATDFQAAPQTRDGRPVVGGRVLIPIVFRVGGPAAAGPSADALRLLSDLPAMSRAMDEHYPQAARAAGIGGQATVDCVVVERRRWSCTPVSEDPAGYGFGEAAVAVMTDRRTRPERGTPTGQERQVTLTFAPR